MCDKEEKRMDNASLNELRYKYLKKLKEAYKKFDFSDLFDDLDENCRDYTINGEVRGKEAVIEELKDSAKIMKENNYRHVGILIQAGEEIFPPEIPSAPDGMEGAGYVGLLYDEGEICMLDMTRDDCYCIRMDISENGKILQWYATIPPAVYHRIR